VGRALQQAAERQAMETDQKRWLSDYAWLDGEQQTARIPIERAMQIVEERGIRGVAPLAGTQDAANPQEEGGK
jgi:hypothetical protein